MAPSGVIYDSGNSKTISAVIIITKSLWYYTNFITVPKIVPKLKKIIKKDLEMCCYYIEFLFQFQTVWLVLKIFIISSRLYIFN